jgi:hypothetical protein
VPKAHANEASSDDVAVAGVEGLVTCAKLPQKPIVSPTVVWHGDVSLEGHMKAMNSRLDTLQMVP